VTDATGEAGRRRVFFALWPDAALKSRIAKATRRIVRAGGGRPVKTDDLHVTVAFVGHVDAAGLERCLDAPPVATGAFELTLDRIGYFERARILWLAPSSVPAALSRLEQTLWDGLTGRGFERETRLFRPHMTLARKSGSVDADVEPVVWPVTELVLLESAPAPRGVRYRPLASWPL
jgi:RNA 2',3'-cyclic 3'-phosphodiesterase